MFEMMNAESSFFQPSPGVREEVC